jgi:polyisoprenoid-binding protein YceI
MAIDQDAVWEFGAADGDLTLHTGVAGRAARMGHRLTIAMTRWQASVSSVAGQPDSATLVVEVDSLEVLKGEGGVKGLSGPEKTLVRSNALKSLSANKFPEIRFNADSMPSICAPQNSPTPGACRCSPRCASPTSASNPIHC